MDVTIWTQNFRKFLFLLSHKFLYLRFDLLSVRFCLFEVVLPSGDVRSEHLVQPLCIQRADTFNVVNIGSCQHLVYRLLFFLVFDVGAACELGFDRFDLFEDGLEASGDLPPERSDRHQSFLCVVCQLIGFDLSQCLSRVLSDRFHHFSDTKRVTH